MTHFTVNFTTKWIVTIKQHPNYRMRSHHRPLTSPRQKRPSFSAELLICFFSQSLRQLAIDHRAVNHDREIIQSVISLFLYLTCLVSKNQMHATCLIGNLPDSEHRRAAFPSVLVRQPWLIEGATKDATAGTTSGQGDGRQTGGRPDGHRRWTGRERRSNSDSEKQENIGVTKK